MGRTIISARDVQKFESTQTGKKQQIDKYTDRLLKYIPAEVLTLYLTLESILLANKPDQVELHWGIFAFGIIATYLYLWRVLKVEKQLQIVISMLAFAVWVFATGGPFVHPLGQENAVFYGSLLLPAFTFLASMVEV